MSSAADSGATMGTTGGAERRRGADGRLSVVGHAMLTALGRDGAATCAALRAGVGGAREEGLWDITKGDFLKTARPRLRQWWEGPTMTPALAEPVIRDCMRQARRLGLVDDARAGATDDRPTLPVLLIVSPPDRPHRSPELERIVLDGLAERFGAPLPEGSGAVAGGRTGILTALRVAHDLISDRAAPACIVVGVESFLRQVLALHYIEANRLLCEANSNGFMPGEAACAVLVTRHGAVATDELLITGIGVGHETSGDGGNAEHPVLGHGLTQAVRQAVDSAGIVFHDLNVSISDHNGEAFKFKEAAIVAGRLDRLPPDGRSRRPRGFMDSWHPAEGIGEVGAAIFPCLLGWAFEAGLKDYAPGGPVLLHAGEDNGERVAIVARFERKE